MKAIKDYHRFLDEAGDPTFYGKGKVNIVGQNGVSNVFILGMIKFKEPLTEIRNKVIELQNNINTDTYFEGLPSVEKRKQNGGFFFHASKDIPEIRKMFFDYIKTIDCSLEAVVARKIPAIFERKHHRKEKLFYADLLSHLLKNKLQAEGKLILNIAERGTSTKNNNLENALSMAVERLKFSNGIKNINTEVKRKIRFNVQTPQTEPLLNVADYLCWTVQRVFEKGEVRFYNYIQDKISLVVDLYDAEKYAGWKNYYTKNNPLTAENKISPLLH